MLWRFYMWPLVEGTRDNNVKNLKRYAMKMSSSALLRTLTAALLSFLAANQSNQILSPFGYWQSVCFWFQICICSCICSLQIYGADLISICIYTNNSVIHHVCTKEADIFGYPTDTMQHKSIVYDFALFFLCFVRMAECTDGNRRSNRKNGTFYDSCCHFCWWRTKMLHAMK